MEKFRGIILKTQFRLVLFLAYIVGLVYAWLIGHSWLHVLYAHVIIVLIFCIFVFGGQFLLFFFAPLVAFGMPIETYRLKKYLARFKRNVPAEVVIVLGHSDWFKLEAWVKPNVIKSELKCLVRCLEANRQDFSFFPNATLTDVEEVMRNENIREVYFVGHGNSHTFQLNTDEILYYCEFNHPKYAKDFVHQIHCGSPHGKSLVDYVVPEENRAKCFLFRKPIRVFTIEREFKKRAKNAPSHVTPRQI